MMMILAVLGSSRPKNLVLLGYICLFVCVLHITPSSQACGNTAVRFKMAPGRFLKKKRKEKTRGSVTYHVWPLGVAKHQQVFRKQLTGGL